MSAHRSGFLAVVASVFIAACVSANAAFTGFVGMTNGYFVDLGTGKPFIPHGIAYQTWNRPLGVWQSWDQINYDLDEMVKMGCNSIRIDMVWQHIEEKGDNQWSWDNYDYLFQQCDKRNIRVFALIGYQWPPNWFKDSWYTMHPPETDSEGIAHTNRWQSDIIGYETPEARAQYAEFFSNVCARYKNTKCVAGWVVGNEYGYLGLWSGLLDGYDPNCEAAFRVWCKNRYSNNIANVNATWGSTYPDFASIKFVEQYRAYGVEGAEWADMVQWREDSIASYTAMGAKAAKQADPNHLISYSTVGMQWGEEDWRYHAEDRGKITAACLASNAPIDFFSVNNYPWSMLGHESQNGQWGISFTKKVAKVPVLYSETGFTSSETMWPGMNETRQGPLIRNAMWESLECGAVGTHIFSWMDRPWITDREKGFGIVYADRGIKPAYWESRNQFELMEQVKIGDLLMGSKDPKPDVAFLWTDAADSQYNRYECEMQQIGGALERLGYEPNFINLADLGSGAYTNYRVIILPRNMRVEDTVPNSGGKTILDFLRQNVIAAGVNIMASADIPGLQNFNGKARTQCVNEVQSLFGVDASDIGGFEAPMRRREYVTWYWTPITVRFNTNALGAVSGGYSYRPVVWKYSDEITLSTGGVVWATMNSERNKGFEDSPSVGTMKGWGVWPTNGNGAVIQQNWGWQYAGTNMLQLWGEGTVWQAFPAVPFGRYTASTYLRSNASDPLRNGSAASIAIEWYGISNQYLGISESPILTTSTPSDSWVKYSVDAIAPSNTYQAVRVIKVQGSNMVANGGLTGSGTAPTSWANWNDVNHDPEYGSYLGTNGNSWSFWQDAGLYQDITTGFTAGDKLKFGGRLYTPDWDRIQNGTKYGVVQLEFYNGTTLLVQTDALPHVEWATQANVWSNSSGEAIVPVGATKVRVIVRCNNPANGSGRFFADDLYVRNATRGLGSVFVDNNSENPAVVVKNHGAAKSAIFLYSVGDNSPDSANDADSEPDTGPWQYRFSILSSIMKDYFGVQPAISVIGTNNWACLPEYRITSNNCVMIQIKNYLYDTTQPNGGASQTFNISSSLLTGKTVRAFSQGRILEENSDGIVWITLPPDGQEILYAYPATAPAQSPNFGSSEQRMWRGKNNRSGEVTTGPATFPLSNAWVRSVTSGNGVVDGDKLFVANNTLLSCLDVNSGNILWQFNTTNTGYGVFNTRGLAAIDGTVYAVTKNNFGLTGAVYAVDQATGQLKWKYSTGSYGVSPVSVQSNVVYFAAVDGYVRALDAQSGSLIWQSPSGYYGCPYNGMALDGGYLYLPNYSDRNLYCISITTGVARWAAYIGGYVDMTPAVVSNRVYAGHDGSGGLKCFDATSGAFLWAATNWISGQRSPAVANGMLYFIGAPITNSSTFYVVAMNATTYGAPVWTFPLPSMYYNSSVVVQSNRLYVSGDQLYVLNALTGSLLWTPGLYAGSWMEPCVKNGRVFMSDTAGVFAYSDGTAWPANPAPSANTNELVQISDAPAVVHPFGDKVYTLKVQYDCRDVVGLKIKAAFQESGDNGDGITNEIYQVLTNSVVGNGEQWFYMWIPDPNQNDRDYISTPDGGKYVFSAWLENTSGVKVAQAVPQPTILEWGVRPTNAVPTNIVKGQVVTLNTEWEDQYEQLWWQNTPMQRNDSYPGRVAVYRSTKTESQFPGHLAKVNQVCDWLETLGYVAANPLDIMFDNVIVAGLSTSDFNAGNYTGWSRVAGALNWTVERRNPKDEPGNELEYNTQATFSMYVPTYQLDFSIVADSARYLDKIDLLIAKVGSIVNDPMYTMSVFADSNGVPTGTSLSKTNFTAASASYTWTSVNMPDIPLEKGKTYHFVMSYASGAISSTNYMGVYFIGPYTTNAPGQVKYSTTSGGSWTAYNNVPTFLITYADTGTYAQTYNSCSVVGSLGNTRYAQTFTLPSPMTLTNIQTYMYKNTTPANGVQVNVRRWSDKALMGTATKTAASIATGYSWVSFPMPSVALAQNTQYFYELVNLDPTATWYQVRANAYGGIYGAANWHGNTDYDMYTTTAGTSWVTEVNYDLDFRAQGTGGQDLALRASRIGNDENYISAGVSTWSNVTVSADIKYNKQDAYFSDAELLLRYVDRNNYYKVGIRNFYGFWRLKYTVKVNGYSQQTGWLYEFPKTNRPAEGVWYNIKVDSQSSTNRVYFNGQLVGAFYATNFPTGKIALGTKAAQLGIWEPKQGYFFIDDDENGYSADPFTNGAPLNMDWGYLNQFYRTLVLPGVYAMNNTEASNMVRWAQLGLNNIIATDGGIAMKNELGASALGRVESLFGVGTTISSISGITKATVGTNDHYATMDYVAGTQIPASGTANAYNSLTRGVSLVQMTNSAPFYGMIVNTITNNPNAPSKAIVFNYGIDTSGQLTNGMKKLAQRAFEWARGQANKVRVELKYTVAYTNSPSADLTLYSTSVWMLAGTGQTNINVQVPSDGIMTGDKLYWVMYSYPWDATNAWIGHDGFYSSGNDNMFTVLPGKGLQILGMTADAFAGRDWDMWAGYNTRSSTVTMTFGIKDKGALSDEDNFNDGDYVGWTLSTNAYVAASVSNGALRAQVVSPTLNYTYITRNGLTVTGKNVTVEYDVLFTNGANEGGLYYRGAYLQLNPSYSGWQDSNPNFFSTNRPASNKWCHVVVHIRDGFPYLNSDVYVDGRPSFVSEPIEISTLNMASTNGILGFVAPYLNASGAVQWDNVRVADEQYSLVYTNVMGEYVPNSPTNPTFWPSIPDYDPAMWEHNGTTKGSQYEWYLYARGEGIHSYQATRVYFSPRLRVESSNFPTVLTAGTNVLVPIEWENLPASNIPSRLRVRLFDAFSGTIYVEQTTTVSTASGFTNMAATIPVMPPGSNYVWSTFIYPTNAINPWVERFGSDDTFRFNEVGIGIEPETMVTMVGAPVTNGTLRLYSDSGTPVGSAIYTWGASGSFNGNYVDATAPEGTMTFYCNAPFTYAGWGLFLQTNLAAYANGYVKFWAKSSNTLKMDLETNPYAKKTVYLGSTGNAWQQFSVAVTNFTGGVGGLNLTNMYGLFEITTEVAGTFYVDDVKWSLTP